VGYKPTMGEIFANLQSARNPGRFARFQIRQFLNDSMGQSAWGPLFIGKTAVSGPWLAVGCLPWPLTPKP